MTYVVYLFLLIAIIWWWAAALHAREKILQFCRAACRDAGYQFLDETVALESMSIRKGSHGLPILCRRYRFEISEDGTDRYPGYVILTGDHITNLFLQGRQNMEYLH
ncbi:MAG TPA: DUF3301 domain-containing protein [Gammaproteobacteria bacterium]|nr:DUF3301 domain-containing protein [Gammaproteobacteria bacterium]